MRDDVEQFQKYFELADLCRLPTIGGWTRKVAEMEQHMARGGRVNEAGSFFVQASRGVDKSADRVIDFFRCLPNNRRGSALIIAYYCSPRMLVEFPDVINHLTHIGVHQDGESWSWSRSLRQSASEYQKHFWRRVHARRFAKRA
jgi:hypothetical protein